MSTACPGTGTYPGSQAGGIYTDQAFGRGRALLPNEADSILIAGMGGELILHILTEGESVCSTAKELILQPQSEIHKAREYLRQHQYKIEDEDMVCEEGKYYPMMRAVKTEQDETWNRLNDQTIAVCDIYDRFF